MPPPDDDQVHQVTGECAAALRTARTALSAATGVLVGSGGTGGMKVAEYALRELRDRMDMLRPAELSPHLGVRAAVAAAHVEGDMERVADLIRQIAEIAWSRRTREPMPSEVRSAVETVSGGALSEVERAGEIVRLEPLAAADAAAALEGGLEVVSNLQRDLDEALMLCGTHIGVSDAVDLALIGRCYEDCARHAVSAARHVAALAP